MGMSTTLSTLLPHPEGEQPSVEEFSATAETFAGRVHVEWDSDGLVTPLGQLPFFVEYLKQAGLFAGWVADCPLTFSSPNAPSKHDLLGTVLLSILSGHYRYAHITALRCDAVNPRLLGMKKVVSEDAVRRGLAKIDEAAGLAWLQTHLDYCASPLLSEPWVLDIDSTIKPLYGQQEGAMVGYNPQKPGRPSHCYHTYLMAWGRCAAWRRTHAKAWSGRTVVAAASPGAQPLAGAAARRRRLGRRTGDVACRAGGAGLSVSPAHDSKRQAGADEDDGRARLDGCRTWLAGQGDDIAPDRLEPATPCRPAAPQARAAAGACRPHPAGAAAARLCRGRSRSGGVGIRRVGDLAGRRDPHAGPAVPRSRRFENTFDELKNQWGWGGFTTQDLKRCRLLAGSVALIFNWWSLFVRLADPDHRPEAITSR